MKVYYLWSGECDVYNIEDFIAFDSCTPHTCALCAFAWCTALIKYAYTRWNLQWCLLSRAMLHSLLLNYVNWTGNKRKQKKNICSSQCIRYKYLVYIYKILIIQLWLYNIKIILLVRESEVKSFRCSNFTSRVRFSWTLLGSGFC